MLEDPSASAPPEASPASEAVRESGALGGRLRLLQPRRGYRAGMDAALLAAGVQAAPGERLLDAGCGAGAALLQVAMRSPGVRLTGIERDPDALALAARNIVLNGLAETVTTRSGDVDAGFGALAEAEFDGAFCNPPFFDDPASLRGPASERRGAWLADGGLFSWTRFLLDAVRPRGRITVIHRADRLADLLDGLSRGAGSFQVRPVQPFADAPAKRVLVRAIRSGRAPLVLLPALVMHLPGQDGHTPEADAILRGEAALSWL